MSGSIPTPDPAQLSKYDFHKASDQNLLKLARYLNVHASSAWRHKHLADVIYYASIKKNINNDRSIF